MLVRLDDGCCRRWDQTVSSLMSGLGARNVKQTNRKTCIHRQSDPSTAAVQQCNIKKMNDSKLCYKNILMGLGQTGLSKLGIYKLLVAFALAIDLPNQSLFLVFLMYGCLAERHWLCEHHMPLSSVPCYSYSRSCGQRLVLDNPFQ